MGEYKYPNAGTHMQFLKEWLERVACGAHQ